MRLTIPPPPAVDALVARGYEPAALASRERFLRGMAATYARVGDDRTAVLLERDADIRRQRNSNVVRSMLGAS
jgi:hypothetical protein